MVGDLYKKLPGGVLPRCLSLGESTKWLKEVHEKSCGPSGFVSLYRRLQRLGYYWPEMSKQAAIVQEQCTNCQNVFDRMESCAVLTASDWRVPFLKYLIEGILPDSHKEAYHLKRLVTRYFVEGGILFRKGFNGEPLRCLGNLEAQLVMQEIHAGEYGDHQGKRRLLQQLLNLGYFWLTMKQDAAECVKTCHTCQVHGNLIHTHPTNLQNMMTPWSFHTWGLDLIGPINPLSKVHIWILVATEYFTKWVKAISIKKATGPAVANFIR